MLTVPVPDQLTLDRQATKAIAAPSRLLADHVFGSRRDLATVDIGSVPWTGLTESAYEAPPQDYIDPIGDVVALTSEEQLALGSDFLRAGFVHPRSIDAEFASDILGADWLIGEDGPSLLGHPLANAISDDIRSYRPPPQLRSLRMPDTGEFPIILDAPCPGILETCCSLRGIWAFLDDCASGRPEATMLLDWAEQFVCERFDSLCQHAPQASIVIYRDWWGSESGPFLSLSEFRHLVVPRLRTVFETIRSRTPAMLGAAVRGSCHPFLEHLVSEGVSVIGVDCNARQMTVDSVRRALGRDVIIHGPVDLIALGKALNEEDKASTAMLACEHAAAMPMIAAASRPARTPAERLCLQRAGRFLHSLNPDDLAELTAIGPVRAILERAAAASGSLPITFPPASQGQPITLFQS